MPMPRHWVLCALTRRGGLPASTASPRSRPKLPGRWWKRAVLGRGNRDSIGNGNLWKLDKIILKDL